MTRRNHSYIFFHLFLPLKQEMGTNCHLDLKLWVDNWRNDGPLHHRMSQMNHLDLSFYRITPICIQWKNSHFKCHLLKSRLRVTHVCTSGEWMLFPYFLNIGSPPPPQTDCESLFCPKQLTEWVTIKVNTKYTSNPIVQLDDLNQRVNLFIVTASWHITN